MEKLIQKEKTALNAKKSTETANDDLLECYLSMFTDIEMIQTASAIWMSFETAAGLMSVN